MVFLWLPVRSTVHRVLDCHIVEPLTLKADNIRHWLEHVALVAAGAELQLALTGLLPETWDLLLDRSRWVLAGEV